MQSDITRRRLLTGSAGSLTALLAGCTGSTPFVGQRLESHRTLSASDIGQLSVVGEVSSIEIAGEDRDDIAIDIVKKASSLRTPLEKLSVTTSIQDGRLDIQTEFTGETGWFGGPPSVDLDIAIPRSIAVEHVASVIGEATIRHVTGDLSIEATTGGVTVEDHDGSVDVRTTTGRIDVDDVTGTVAAEASTGRVSVTNVGTTGDLGTSTGRIEAEVRAIDGDTAITTGTGRIEVAVSRDLDAELAARTSTGSVSNDGVPLQASVSERTHVQGEIGAGGPKLELEARTGSVTIEPLD